MRGTRICQVREWERERPIESAFNQRDAIQMDIQRLVHTVPAKAYSHWIGQFKSSLMRFTLGTDSKRLVALSLSRPFSPAIHPTRRAPIKCRHLSTRKKQSHRCKSWKGKVELASFGKVRVSAAERTEKRWNADILVTRRAPIPYLLAFVSFPRSRLNQQLPFLQLPGSLKHYMKTNRMPCWLVKE